MLTGHKFTGMAQRQRAGLITPRSQDRNLLPVFIIISQWCIEALEQHFTGMAQRQRAGLITPRSQDQNLLPVFIICQLLQKLVV